MSKQHSQKRRARITPPAPPPPRLLPPQDTGSLPSRAPPAPQERPLSPPPHVPQQPPALFLGRHTPSIRDAGVWDVREGRRAQVSVPGGGFGFPALNPSQLGQGRGGSLTFRDFRWAGYSSSMLHPGTPFLRLSEMKFASTCRGVPNYPWVGKGKEGKKGRWKKCRRKEKRATKAG